MSATPTRIDPLTLAERLATGSTTVLDVCTPGEHAAAAIPGSQLLPLDQLERDRIVPLGPSLVLAHRMWALEDPLTPLEDYRGAAAGQIPDGHRPAVVLRDGVPPSRSINKCSSPRLWLQFWL